MRAILVLAVILGLGPVKSFAQAVEVQDDSKPTSDDTQTGKARADKYFQSRKPKKSGQDETSSGSSSASGPRYLAVHFGTFFSDQSYNWADGRNNLHNFNAGVTYRLGEWVNSMDFSIRLEYTDYSFTYYSARKISIVPLITFPDAASRFPLYFGGGIGPGLFIQQVPDRSPLALDWQIFAGVRVLDIWPHAGLMVESGLKNHVLIASPGQFNGVYINVGAVFVF